MPVVFPMHPRTRKMLDGASYPGVTVTDPVGYLDFLSLEFEAGAVLTDSGGIQEETTYLGIPCFTLRDNTERPVTIRAGTNTLLGLDPARITEIPELLQPVPQQTGPVPQAKPRNRRAPIFGMAGRRSGSPMSLRVGRFGRCRCRASFPGTGSSSTSSTRQARTPCEPLGCSRRCSTSGPTRAASLARSCSPSRRATGSPTTSSSVPTRPSSRRSTSRTSTAWRRRLDDIVDHIEETADFMGLYRIEAPMEQAQGMADVLVKACEQLAMLLEESARVQGPRASTGSRSTGSRTTAIGSSVKPSPRCSLAGPTRCW